MSWLWATHFITDIIHRAFQLTLPFNIICHLLSMLSAPLRIFCEKFHVLYCIFNQVLKMCRLAGSQPSFVLLIHFWLLTCPGPHHPPANHASPLSYLRFCDSCEEIAIELLFRVALGHFQTLSTESDTLTQQFSKFVGGLLFIFLFSFFSKTSFTN